jgi:hypothetical protein
MRSTPDAVRSRRVGVVHFALNYVISRWRRCPPKQGSKNFNHDGHEAHEEESRSMESAVALENFDIIECSLSLDATPWVSSFFVRFVPFVVKFLCCFFASARAAGQYAAGVLTHVHVPWRLKTWVKTHATIVILA